jgi:hypothetical protein
MISKCYKKILIYQRLPASEDIAIIKNRENVGKIYILEDEINH